MGTRALIGITLAVLIALLSVCPVPAGHGSFSSVYGPTTAFRAYRAALQLQFAFAAILFVVLPFQTRGTILALRPFLGGAARLLATDAKSSSFLPDSAVLRC